MVFLFDMLHALDTVGQRVGGDNRGLKEAEHGGDSFQGPLLEQVAAVLQEGVGGQVGGEGEQKQGSEQGQADQKKLARRLFEEDHDYFRRARGAAPLATEQGRQAKRSVQNMISDP